LTIDVLARGFSAIESRRLIPVTILIHPYHLRDFRTWNLQSTSKIFDEVNKVASVNLTISVKVFYKKDQTEENKMSLKAELKQLRTG